MLDNATESLIQSGNQLSAMRTSWVSYSRTATNHARKHAAQAASRTSWVSNSRTATNHTRKRAAQAAWPSVDSRASYNRAS